ncbi:MAG: type II secretion system protein [Candidatus Kerfeldbacteria bacterium]|nr:type II secretion system protein [Candidatus Kerfeldbacteria bacterium]
MKNQKGFTLIELLIVIAIIGLLATLAIVSLTSAQQRARDTKRVSDMRSLQTAFELYYNDKAIYPVLSDGTDTWVELQTKMKTYVNDILPLDPNDSNGDAYVYLTNNTDQYVIGATLEDTAHKALEQDIDAAQGGAGWMSVTSTDTYDGVDATLNCDAAVYCLSGNASGS